MRRECDEFEDVIWRRARKGQELSEEARRHVESCGECARALREARRLSVAIADAASVSNSPDCRASVMAAISREQQSKAVTLSLSKGPAWAYACAVVLIAAVIAVGMVANRPRDTVRAPLVVKKVVPDVPKPPTPSPAPEIAKAKAPQPKQIAETPVPAPHRTIRTVKHARLTPPPTPIPQPPSPERVVAAVAVTWPTKEELQEDSYSYIERDAETGETTTCSVKRSGDEVEIYIESTPGGEEPPVKGSIENESKSNA